MKRNSFVCLFCIIKPPARLGNCKYHIVFAPKYRRQVFYKSKRSEIGQILRKLCELKGVEILEAEVCPDHKHMLVKIPPKVSVLGYLKGKSNRRG